MHNAKPAAQGSSECKKRNKKAQKRGMVSTDLKRSVAHAMPSSHDAMMADVLGPPVLAMHPPERLNPESLSPDLQLAIASFCDGKTLATFCECTSRSIARSTSGSLDGFWHDLYNALPKHAVPSSPSTSDAKTEYVRAWAAAHGACPRCGKQSRKSVDGVLEDGYALSQRHLCDFFLKPTPSADFPYRHPLSQDSFTHATGSLLPLQPALKQVTLARWLLPRTAPPTMEVDAIELG